MLSIEKSLVFLFLYYFIKKKENIDIDWISGGEMTALLHNQTRRRAT
jgi:hypothetical protein